MKRIALDLDVWVVTLNGKLIEWEWMFGEGNQVKGPIHTAREDAARLARLHAERTEEVSTAVDVWEMAHMPMREVYRRGYRITRTSASVMLPQSAPKMHRTKTPRPKK